MDSAEKRGTPSPLLVTIFLGANDACLTAFDTLVPLSEYEEHIRTYVNSILEHHATEGTKVVLITPPPVDVPSPGEIDEDTLPEILDTMRAVAKGGRGHRTWESKRKFAQKIIEIGREFEAKSDLVTVLDLWTAITKSACNKHGNLDYDELDVEDMLPGSGMPGAKTMGKGFFLDGLHFGKTVWLSRIDLGRPTISRFR